MIQDSDLIDILLAPVRKCALYKPAFGLKRNGGLSVAEFQNLYGEDLFYSWIGLDTPMVYAAHRAAGGITSVYRQLGTGCEKMFQFIVRQQLGISADLATWSYEYAKADGSLAVHTLDAKIAFSNLQKRHLEKFENWIHTARHEKIIGAQITTDFAGLVFEVRQGYKSADSKRQNADLRFGMRSYQESYLPIVMLFSAQISEPVARRYRSDGILVLRGTSDDSAFLSTFAFIATLLDYNLMEFFARNSAIIKAEMNQVIHKLLSAD